jgi:hypothetical protein
VEDVDKIDNCGKNIGGFWDSSQRRRRGGKRKKEEGRRKKEEGRRKKEGGGRKKEASVSRGRGGVKKQGRGALCYTVGSVRYHSGVTMDDIILKP